MKKFNLRVCSTVLSIFLLTVMAEFMAIAFEQVASEPVPWMFKLSDDELRKLYNIDGKQEVQSYRELLRETWSVLRPTRYSPFVEYQEGGFFGKYLTVAPEGYRFSENQFPWKTQKPKIFVFGGSTSFGYGVKNNETISSYLQKILLTQYNIDFAVYNFGAASYYSSVERVLFEKLVSDGNKPSVAIFIDGLNDIYHHDIPSKSVVSDGLQFGYEHPIRAGMERLLQKLALYRGIKKNFPDAAPNVKISNGVEEELRKNKINAAERLTKNRQMLFSTSCGLGVLPIFVHQPVPVYNYDRNKAITPDQFVRLGKHADTKIGYEYLNEKRDKAGIFNKNMLWLQDLQIEANQYVDTVHYSPKFNEAIAGEIAKLVSRKLSGKICDI